MLTLREEILPSRSTSAPTVVESNAYMTLVRCSFTGWIATERLTFIA